MRGCCWRHWKSAMIDLNPNYLEMVKRILADHVPECEVRAFGSRATWTAKHYSDLDLAVVGHGPLTTRTLGHLKEALQESDLPMRVDVLDWHSISESFQKVIERDCVVVQKGSKLTKAAEWRAVTLGDVCTKIGSGATPRGGRKSILETDPTPSFGAKTSTTVDSLAMGWLSSLMSTLRHFTT